MVCSEVCASMCTYLGMFSLFRGMYQNRLNIPEQTEHTRTDWSYQNRLNIPEQTEHTRTDWTYLGMCTYWTYQNRLYNSMNVVRAGTLGKMTGTYCTYPDLVSSPPWSTPLYNACYIVYIKHHWSATNLLLWLLQADTCTQPTMN